MPQIGNTTSFIHIYGFNCLFYLTFILQPQESDGDAIFLYQLGSCLFQSFSVVSLTSLPVNLLSVRSRDYHCIKKPYPTSKQCSQWGRKLNHDHGHHKNATNPLGHADNNYAAVTNKNFWHFRLSDQCKLSGFVYKLNSKS